jgi:putative ABC transport system permease protein
MRTGISLLDVKLGLRMLARYPGLTLVAGLGMAVAIAVGAGFFAFIDAYVLPTLPLDEGDRIVGIESWDAGTSEREPRILHDFVAWRGELRSLEDLGAFRTIRRNLIAADAAAEPVPVAEMTASGFRVARVPPLLGRYLVEEDEREGAPPVVVIGHDVWRTRFGLDPDVVGRDLRLGGAVHTVVGVMPEGFAFPMNFRFWIPLRASVTDYERRAGPELFVFGRLASGVTREQAQAELTAIGLRAAAAFPATHGRLRPRIVPFTAVFGLVTGGAARWALFLVQLLVSMLLVVVAVNVAILVYARTATRRGEIVVRSALGAGRRRIVAQLFAEALVLSVGAAALGLVLAGVALGQLHTLLEDAGAQEGGLPFWIDPRLSAATVLYVLGLTLLGAAIVGVVPALQATGRRLQTSLRQLGGGTGLQLGRTWTVLVVAQVAFAVAVLPAAVSSASEWIRYGFAQPGFAAEEFLTARLEMDRESPPSAEAEAYEREFAARYGDRRLELARRLEAEPGVRGVTFASDLPGHEPTRRIEIDGLPTPAGSAAGHAVRSSAVDVGFFDLFGVPVLAGRGFHAADPGAAAAPAVVSRAFVRQHLDGGTALGRRVRYVGGDGDAEPARWYEIVGVVGDLPPAAMEPGSVEARLYHPLAPGEVHPAILAVRMRGSAPAALAMRLREVAAALDPALRAHEVLPLDEVYRQGEQGVMRVGAWAILLVTASVLLLSAAGIYALMSLTVTRRRREIGIRSALGADPRRILRGVFARAGAQLALGLLLGVAAAALLDVLAGGALMDGNGVLLLPAVAALMLAVGLLAALGPARRGLRIEPSEALRAEA